MKQIKFEIKSNNDVWSLIDRNYNTFLIDKFNPHDIVEWWKTDLKTHNGFLLENLNVRMLECDVQTDLDGLKKILDLNTQQLRIYQFDKAIPDTLEFQHLADESKFQILKQNGLKHFYFLDFEILSIASFDEEFILKTKDNPITELRI